MECFEMTSEQKSFWLKAALGALVIGVVYYFSASYLKEYLSPAEVLEYIEASGPLAPLVFIAAYGFLPIMPASAMTIAGGALFGPVYGTIYSLIGATIAMSYPFWITRWFGRKPLDYMLARTGDFEQKFEKFQCNVDRQGWKYVAFTRLVPFFPFALLNYFFGLTRISFWKYLVTSTIFIIPGCLTYVYIGHVGIEAASGSSGVYWKVALAFTGIALLALVPKLISRLRKKKDEDTC